MEKISLDLKNCYGIKNLEEPLVFINHNRFIGIYSPNGMMKTSLAKTFLCVSKGEDVPNDIFGNDSSMKILIDKESVKQEDILVIESFDNNLENLDISSSSALLLNDELKKKYDDLLSKEKEKRKEILSDIKEKSGLSEDEFQKEVEKVFESKFEEVIEKKVVNSSNLAENQSAFLEINYKKFFNNSLERVCASEDVKKKFKEYHKKISDTGFFNDNFTPTGFWTIKSSLEKNSFFSNNRNKIVIYDEEKEKEFKTVEDMKKFVEEQIGAATEQIIKILDKNEDTRNIAKQLNSNPNLVSQLEDIKKFKQNVLLAYLYDRQEQCSMFLTAIEENKQAISRIKKVAEKEETIWENVLKIFENRFSIPFEITIKNKLDAVLGNEEIKYFDFKIKRGEESIDRGNVQDLGFLSTGEKKALYILRMIFNIELRKKKLGANKELLIILDDIVDSFDYRNKYAVLQYLKDFKECENNIYFVILTHNFDFFRNLVRKDILKGDFDNKLIATSKEGNISINKFESHLIQNAFGKLAVGGDIGSIETIACIPFLRTLLEMQRKTEGEEYESLTSMLHINKNSDKQTVSEIGKIYKKVLEKELKIDGSLENKKVRDYIRCIIRKEIIGKDIKENELYKKVCLSVGVRLLAEEFCIKNLKKKISEIGDSTKIFSDFLNPDSITSEEKELIKAVSMGTPDYIHSNSFMYEPLIDQSANELSSLYTRLYELVNGTNMEN